MPQMSIDQAMQIAVAQHRAGKLRESALICQQVLTAQPKHLPALHLLGVICGQAGQLDKATQLLRHAISLAPQEARLHFDLAFFVRRQGKVEESIAGYRRAIALKPDFAEAHSNLGIVLRSAGRLEESITSHRTALALQPGLPQAHCNLGAALRLNGQIDEAIAAYRRALELSPDFAEAHSNLGNALADIAQADEAIGCFRQALKLNPRSARVHDNLLMAMHCQSPLDPQAILTESQAWNQQHAEPLKQSILPHANDRNPDRRLRIGYVSPDFREHPVGRFMLPLLSSHDRAAFEIFCYSDATASDEMTRKLSPCADVWRNTAGQPIADLVRADRIDILVDLAGHTLNNRLLDFARKPAPVQITVLGYPGTTGLATMDYRLTDVHADPPDQPETYCTEELIRLPRTAWCFSPPQPDISPRQPPAISAGHVTFGSFNNLSKMNAPLMRMWASILGAAPGSRLLLKARAFNSSAVQDRIRRMATTAGIEPERIELCGWMSPADHWAAFSRIDIALDSYPYHGTTTTCEAIWMGVPVITRAGNCHVSRVGVSLLSNIGAPEWIAQSDGDYLRIAVELANDLPRLAELGSTLRPRIESSPLMDARGFARDIEDAYRAVWRRWSQKVLASPAAGE